MLLEKVAQMKPKWERMFNQKSKERSVVYGEVTRYAMYKGVLFYGYVVTTEQEDSVTFEMVLPATALEHIIDDLKENRKLVTYFLPMYSGKLLSMLIKEGKNIKRVKYNMGDDLLEKFIKGYYSFCVKKNRKIEYLQDVQHTVVSLDAHTVRVLYEDFLLTNMLSATSFACIQSVSRGDIRYARFIAYRKKYIVYMDYETCIILNKEEDVYITTEIEFRDGKRISEMLNTGKVGVSWKSLENLVIPFVV